VKKQPSFLLVVAACVCFGIAVLTSAGILSIASKINWTDLGLLLGFLSYLL
jgi:hypothetical protein